VISSDNKVSLLLKAIVFNSSSNSYKYDFTVESNNGDELTEGDLKAYLEKYEYYMYAYDTPNCFFEVYEDERLLELGKDYSYSLDGKSEWLIEKPTNKYFYRETKEKVAGNFYIKLETVDYTKVYSIKYKIERKQNLTEGIDLINEKMSIDEKYQNNYGFIQNVILCRNSLKDSEEICIVDEYTNVIFENEFKERSGKSITLQNKGSHKNKKRSR